MNRGSACSDLHLEFGDCYNFPGGDLLILAGDTWVAKFMTDLGTLLTKEMEEYVAGIKEKYIRFCLRELPKYKKVLLIGGNHEPYNHGIAEDTKNIVNEFLAKYAPNAKFLDNEVEEIDGVAFVCSTLWATYGTKTGHDYHIQRRMADFQHIKTKKPMAKPKVERVGGWPGLDYLGVDSRELYRSVTPADLAEQHRVSRNFIRRKVKEYGESGTPVVVVTHHAPSFQSLSNGTFKYEDDGVDEAYCSNLEQLIKANDKTIKLFIHGHTHLNCRYRIGDTLVVSNQRGYVGKEECAKVFNPAAIDFDFTALKAPGPLHLIRDTEELTHA